MVITRRLDHLTTLVFMGGAPVIGAHSFACNFKEKNAHDDLYQSLRRYLTRLGPGSLPTWIFFLLLKQAC